MTVAQNIALVPKMVGWSKSRIKDAGRGDARPGRPRSRASSTAAIRASSPAASSSASGVARALAADPPVLLMDEPFGAVDPITRDHLQDELIRLQHELHKTIVLRHPRLRRGDQARRPDRGAARALAHRPVRHPGGDPHQPGRRLRVRLRGRGRRAEAAEPHPRTGRGDHRLPDGAPSTTRSRRSSTSCARGGTNETAAARQAAAAPTSGCGAATSCAPRARWPARAPWCTTR